MLSIYSAAVPWRYYTTKDSLTELPIAEDLPKWFIFPFFLTWLNFPWTKRWMSADLPTLESPSTSTVQLVLLAILTPHAADDDDDDDTVDERKFIMVEPFWVGMWERKRVLAHSMFSVN